MFNKNKEKVTFYSFIDGLENEKEIVPVPAKKFLPYWWLNTPIKHNDMWTLKKCPAIPDFFTEGYIIPMWRNILINSANKDNVQYALTEDKYEFPPVDFHPDDQFLIHNNIKIGDRKIDKVIKFNSPWHVVTPKGWSTLVLPIFYNFNPNYTILPGIVDTDMFHQMNHPVLVHAKGNNFEISRGDPFIMYIPFKRTKANHNIISKNFSLSNKITSTLQDWENKNKIGNAYRRMQKERDQYGY